MNSYAIETCFDLLSLYCFDFLVFKTRDSLSHLEIARDKNQRKQKEKLKLLTQRLFLNAFDDAILTELNLSDHY